jgi:hypothetical protein
VDNFSYFLWDISELFPKTSTETGDIAEKDTPVHQKTTKPV